MKKYKYNRSDFSPLPVKLDHIDIELNFIDGKVEARQMMTMTARERLETITLDAQDIAIRSIAVQGSEFKVQGLEAEFEEGKNQKRTPNAQRPTPNNQVLGEVEFDYQTEKSKLVVMLPEAVEEGTTFALDIRNTCVPTDNILEGLYLDTTPEGAPQQYMSQCQQWGYQRIMPIFDDCTAKCTMTTVIEADARYTHLVSNGNIDHEQNPDGKPVLKEGDPSRQIIKYNNPVPMAPYLYLICVGTWDVLEDEVTYPSGRKVKLEYLVSPGNVDGARIPMEILKDSILWHGRTQEYEYPFEVYRTITMEKSNFGGMENVGNTTISGSAALIDEWSTDGRLEYAYGVIIHEFEHNQCGSEVTMMTPFDIWLNEAFTVHVEEQYSDECFDPDALRAKRVARIRNGPLSTEDAGHKGNVVREGFNEPDEMIDGVTYVKSAEIIRMLRLIIGDEAFLNAKNAYFSKFKGGNADTDDFFDCFEQVSGRDLSQFKKEWLYTIGYPKLEATHSYDNETRTLKVDIKQTRSGSGGLFHLPFVMAAVDQEGNDIPGTVRMVEITEAETKLVFEDIQKPAFLSLNRDYSFYGTFEDDAGPEQLLLQVDKDSNGFNRVEAMRRLTDVERIKLIKDPDASVDGQWLELYRTLVNDKSIPIGLKASMLGIGEASLDRTYVPYFREKYAARRGLLKALAGFCLDDLIRVFGAVDTYHKPESPKDGIEERRLKATLLRPMIEANTPEIHKLAEDHFHNAWNLSDKVSALAIISQSEHPRREELFAEAFELWKDNLNGYSNYLALVSGGIHDDVFDDIKREEERASFLIEHPNHARALYLGMSNKVLWTERGIEWFIETIIKLAPINSYTTGILLSTFEHVQKMPDDIRPAVIKALETLRDQIDPEKHASIAGLIKNYLG
jgi:aminopeptidase N